MTAGRGFVVLGELIGVDDMRVSEGGCWGFAVRGLAYKYAARRPIRGSIGVCWKTGKNKSHAPPKH